MRKLRFLSLKNVVLTGSFEETFEKLRGAQLGMVVLCDVYLLNFTRKKLVILELPHSKTGNNVGAKHGR